MGPLVDLVPLKPTPGLNGAPSGFWCGLLGGGAAEFFEEAGELAAFGGGERGGGLFHVPGVLRKGAGDELFAGGGELDEADALIGGIGRAADQAFGLEAVNGRGDGAAGEQNFLSDGVYRLRALVEEQLEGGEV